MLLDELTVALNDLITVLREASNAYETARQTVEDESCRVFFEAARDRHRDSEASIEERQRALGHLPKQPDPELGLVRDAMTRLNAKLAADEVVALLDNLRYDEERVIGACEAFTALAGSDDLAEMAQRIIDAAKEHVQRIETITATLRRR